MNAPAVGCLVINALAILVVLHVATRLQHHYGPKQKTHCLPARMRNTNEVNASTYHVSVESGRGEEVVPSAAFAVSQRRRLLQLLAEVDLQNSEHALRSLTGVLQAV